MMPATPLRVLCVMQDPVDRLAMQDYGWILEWDMTLCRDLQHCVELASRRPVDLIVSDLHQGPPCGLEMVKTIRIKNSANGNVPALLLTDQDIPEKAMAKADQMGAAVVRLKPLLLSDLKLVATRLASASLN